jgi:hypothetical protein
MLMLYVPSSAVFAVPRAVHVTPTNSSAVTSALFKIPLLATPSRAVVLDEIDGDELPPPQPDNRKEEIIAADKRRNLGVVCIEILQKGFVEKSQLNWL